MTREGALRVLGLGGGATAAEVQRAYVNLVEAWHPDRFAKDDPALAGADAALNEIHEAYRVLQTAPPDPVDGPSMIAAPNPQENETSTHALPVALDDAVRLRKTSLRLAGAVLLVGATMFVTNKVYDAVLARSAAEPNQRPAVRGEEDHPSADGSAAASQSVVPGDEGEIELHNETQLEGTLALSLSEAPDGQILKSSPLPADGGAVLRGLAPATYVVDVTFANYPGAAVHLGPFAIARTATNTGPVTDRYEIHLKPRSRR